MARDVLPVDGFTAKAMPRGEPCTCSANCRSRSTGVVFLGLFLLSLSLHAVTLVCYMDLRSEVKREIIHHKRDSMLTLAGSDLGNTASGVFPPDPPRFEPRSSRSADDPEVNSSRGQEQFL